MLYLLLLFISRGVVHVWSRTQTADITALSVLGRECHEITKLGTGILHHTYCSSLIQTAIQE